MVIDPIDRFATECPPQFQIIQVHAASFKSPCVADRIETPSALTYTNSAFLPSGLLPACPLPGRNPWRRRQSAEKRSVLQIAVKFRVARFRPSELLPSGSFLRAILNTHELSFQLRKGARCYSYEAFRTATEIWEWKAVFRAGIFLPVEGTDAVPHALISLAKVQRYMAA